MESNSSMLTSMFFRFQTNMRLSSSDRIENSESLCLRIALPMALSIDMSDD